MSEPTTLVYLESFDSDHSEISPSSAHRWLNCPGSVKMKRDLEIPGTSSEAAAEGTAAHWFCEQVLKQELPFSSTEYLDSRIVVTNTDHAGVAHTYETLIDPGFIAHCKEYIDFCQEIALGSDYSAVEPELPMSHLTAIDEVDTHGYVDFMSLSDSTLTIVDLKFGRNVWVDCQNNSQLMMYALAAYDYFKAFGEITKVVMVIHQPRMDNISVWETSPEELNDWNLEKVQPAVDAIRRESEEVNVDLEGACKWCPVKEHCKPHWEALSIDMFGPAPDTITEEDLALKLEKSLTEEERRIIFLKSKQIKSWLTKLENGMTSDAITFGAPEGMKLVEGRRTRRWTDAEKAENAIARIKVSAVDRRSKPELLSPPKIEKIIGKGHPIMEKYVEVSPGRPTLVSEDDPRPPLVDDTASDFDDLK